MEVNAEMQPVGVGKVWAKLSALLKPYQNVPLIGWLLAALVVVLLEQFIGYPIARGLGLSKAPALFGVALILDKPAQFPGAFLYMIVVYAIPIGITARYSKSLGNRLAAWLVKYPLIVTAAVHLAMLYMILQIWTDVSSYRLLVARLAMIAIIVTLSLNVVNGYMGEFSCSHPGFMSLGAYTASIFTVIFFVSENRFGEALLPTSLGPFFVPPFVDPGRYRLRDRGAVSGDPLLSHTWRLPGNHFTGLYVHREKPLRESGGSRRRARH